jgi:hypothetical protein
MDVKIALMFFVADPAHVVGFPTVAVSSPCCVSSRCCVSSPHSVTPPRWVSGGPSRNDPRPQIPFPSDHQTPSISPTMTATPNDIATAPPKSSCAPDRDRPPTSGVRRKPLPRDSIYGSQLSPRSSVTYNRLPQEPDPPGSISLRTVPLTVPTGSKNGVRYTYQSLDGLNAPEEGNGCGRVKEWWRDLRGWPRRWIIVVLGLVLVLVVVLAVLAGFGLGRRT